MTPEHGPSERCTQPRSPLLQIIEDDPTIAEPLVFGLAKEGFQVMHASTGAEGLEQIGQQRPDLVLLDIMLPDMDGYEICRRLRARDPALPIIMLTARGQEMERVMGLEIGADDYIVKPFSFRELVARIQVQLRHVGRQPAETSSALSIGDITLDIQARQASLRGQPVKLSQREFDLLLALMQHAGQALSRQELLDRVWGETWVGNPRVLDVYIRWLREKFEADPANPCYLETVYGYGYRFKCPSDR
ncbi:MAG: DNA-binding response regulator [Candidatus Roseilinea sp.]|nr:MAG: DNA-binding response regulator [Candidatus Roseilinea sp.]